MSQSEPERSNPTDIADHQNGLLLTDNRICHRVYTIIVCPMAYEYNEDHRNTEHKESHWKGMGSKTKSMDIRRRTKSDDI